MRPSGYGASISRTSDVPDPGSSHASTSCVDLTENRIRLMWRKNAIGEWKESWLSIGEELVTMLTKQRRITGLLGFVFMWQTTDGGGKWYPYQYRQH